MTYRLELCRIPERDLRLRLRSQLAAAAVLIVGFSALAFVSPAPEAVALAPAAESTSIDQ